MSQFNPNLCSGLREVANVFNEPNFYKLKQGPMGTLQTKYEWFLVSGFIEDFMKIGQKLHKITLNFMENRGSIPI